MLILHDNDNLAHRTVELLGAKVIPALESPERITKILETLKDSHHDVRRLSLAYYPTAEERSAVHDASTRSHDQGYLEHLETAHTAWVDAGLITEDESILPECFQFRHRARRADLPPIKPKDIYALAGYYAFDMSTGIMKDTWKSACASAHLAGCAAELATASMAELEHRPCVWSVEHFNPAEVSLTFPQTGAQDVLALCRPPGHHCDTKSAGGYCYINNAVVAATRFLQTNPQIRVGILDIDFHHGNGTQDYFYDRSDVMYISIHGQDEYPYYTGKEDETGTEAGEGYNLNLPLPPQSTLGVYMSTLAIALQRMQDYAPDFLIISLGFDTYRLDPLGSFDIDTEDYTGIARRIRTHLSDMPALILLEGGYVLNDLGKNLLAFLDGWEVVK